jgi:hypothetical protein
MQRCLGFKFGVLQVYGIPKVAIVPTCQVASLQGFLDLTGYNTFYLLPFPRPIVIPKEVRLRDLTGTSLSLQ